MQMLQSGREVITVNGNLPNNNFQAFISNLTLEDLYNNDYHIYKATKDVPPGILETNTTAGRQLLQSIGREFPSIHSSLEIENTMSISVLQILIEIFQQVDITQLKLDMQFKMHSILDITDKKCIQDSTLLPVKKKFILRHWLLLRTPHDGQLSRICASIYAVSLSKLSRSFSTRIGEF